MPPELLVLGIVGLLIVAVGVPAIRRGTFLPRDFLFETPADDALTDRQRDYFQKMDAAVSPLGYSPFLNFEVTNMQGGNLTRVYRSDYDPAILAVSCLRAHATEPLRTRQPRFPHGRDILGEYRDYHQRWCAFQESHGLLHYDVTADVYRATGKVAWRGVANFLNPLADNFTPARFALGLVLGAGIPALGALLARDPAALRALAAALGVSTAARRWLILGAAYTVSGAAVGWLFTAKSFIWALVLGYLPLRLIQPHAGLQKLLAVWMAFVAERVSAWRMKRELLV